MEEIITDEIIDTVPVESETILIKSETNELKIDEPDDIGSEEILDDIGSEEIQDDIGSEEIQDDIGSEEIQGDIGSEEVQDTEDIQNDGTALVTDVKMIECPVCRLNVISFMMEEHKNTCSGADECILGTDNYSVDNDDLDEEDRKDISLDAESGEGGENEEEDVDDDENKLFKCPNKGCNKVYKKKFFLSRHLKHTNCTGIQIKYECKVCGRAYSRPDNLRAHLRSAHVDNNITVKDKSVNCPHCDKVLKNKAILLVHMRIHTGERPYQCDLCPKAFPTSGAYQKHKRVHTGERPFMCPQCKRRFTAKEVLNRHMKTHSAVKPHVCMFCSKSFVQAMQLRAHMFHHTGEYSCICKTCGAAFSKQSALTLHVKYEHEGAKPLECEVCKKTFLTKNFLVRHQIIHSGVKDHECPNCKKRFISKPALKTHMLTHRHEEPRICYDCGRAYIRLDCLIRHMRAKHRDVLQDMIASAETKKIRQLVLSAQPQLEKGTNWSDDLFVENLKKLLIILIDEATLTNFGWPHRPIDKILDSLIIRCGSVPVTEDNLEFIDRLRENTKILFTGIINDDALEVLLNNNTVDEVVNFVLQLSCAPAETNESNDVKISI